MKNAKFLLVIAAFATLAIVGFSAFTSPSDKGNEALAIPAYMVFEITNAEQVGQIPTFTTRAIHATLSAAEGDAQSRTDINVSKHCVIKVFVRQQ